jgi:hypothetical protein
MRSASDIRTIGWAVAAAALLGSPALAGDVYVVCNSDVSLQAADVRDVFIGEKAFAGSVKLAPADNSAAQAQFLEKVVKLDAARYSNLWTKKSFRDGVSPPPVKSSDAEAVAYVKQTPGGCSYIQSAPPGGVTVVAKL